MSKFRSLSIAAAVSAACSLLLANAVRAEEIKARQFDIDAQTLSAALSEFARQSQQEILFAPDIVAKKHSSGVRGNLNPIEALSEILRDTGLTFATTPQGAILVQPEKTSQTAAGFSRIRVAQTDTTDEGRMEVASDASRAADNATASSTSNGPQNVALKVPEVLVVGSRMLNMDIRRSRDDPQPYVIFSRETIEQSGAVDVNDFLKNRLTMNAAGGSNGQVGNVGGPTSGVNLRGLGENQTLILIDGRRAAKTSAGFSPGQPDLNGIPLAAIERIEVLPTTASAIYGGAATGGVVNIILRRDYSGVEVSATYDNTFDSDSSSRRIDFASGFNFFEGRTNVLVSGSYSESNPLQVKDRDLVQRGRARIVENNPGYLQSRTFPPFGAAANIVSTSGANLVLDNGTPLHASFASAPVGYGGIASDGGAALAANAGRYNLDLPQSSLYGYGADGTFVPAPRVKAVSGTLRHRFDPRLQGFLEASHAENAGRAASAGSYYSTLPANSPANPFQQAITVTAPTAQLNGINASKSVYDRFGAGLIYRLPYQWIVSADYTYTEAELSYRQAPALGPAFGAALANGSLDILQDADAYAVDLAPYVLGYNTIGTPLPSTTKNPAIRLSGPLGKGWQAGAPQLSMLFEQQDVKYGTGSQIVVNGTLAAFFPERTQKIDSAYMELRIPLLSSANAVPWAKELELQLAARWDRYRSKNANYVVHSIPGTPPPAIYITNDVDDVNPLLALRFRPIDSLTLRASWGTGFIPPEINQLTAPLPDESVGNYIDPRRGNTGPVAPYILIQGGNPNLQPESSTSWSAGLIWTPAWLDGLRLSLDYTRIRKEDNIATLSWQQILDNEAYLPGRVTRGPNLPTDAAGWAGPVTVIDRTTTNSAWAEVETYDLQLNYDLPRLSFGNLAMFALATWQPTYDTQLAASLPVLDQAGVGSDFGPIPVEFKANAGITWSNERWAAGWNTRYMDSYDVANRAAPSSAVTFLNQGNGGRVASQIYHDVFAKYSFESAAGSVIAQRLDGLELQVGVRNLFNTKPPFDVNNGFQYYSWLGDPRLASYYITLKQSF